MVEIPLPLLKGSKYLFMWFKILLKLIGCWITMLALWWTNGIMILDVSLVYSPWHLILLVDVFYIRMSPVVSIEQLPEF